MSCVDKVTALTPVSNDLIIRQRLSVQRDVQNDRKPIVGSDRAIGQDTDRFRAKRALDMDLARRDIRQGRCWN